MYVLRHLGVSRREAGLMPAWERDALVRRHKEHLGIGMPSVDLPEAQGNLSASDVAILTTPGVG